MASVGIDLGTTNSVLSRLTDGRATPIFVDGSPTMPSIVLFDGDRVVVGREAKNLELLHPERTIRSVKRRMGTTHRFDVGDRMLTPEEVSAEILRALRQAAEAATGEPVSDVVITVPAYFDDAQRRATLRAGELAGLNVLRLLNEPTGASLCYTGPEEAKDRPELMLVYDLGGGTFDVSVLEVFQGVREVRATAGNTRLGGDDFDDKIVSILLETLKKQGADPREDARAMARLRRLAEEAKIRLSTETRTHVREEFLTKAGERSVHLDVEITRRAFEEAIGGFLDTTIELAKKAVKDAGIAITDLSRVCLVGGSTRIPRVRELIEAAFSVPVHEEIDPDLAVGLGASIQAGMLQGEPVEKVLVDVTAHTLGIRALGADDEFEADTFAPILRRNTVLPAVRAKEFYTVVDDQKAIEVEVFQGEEPRASANTQVGAFKCELEPRPAHSPVAVEFTYDLNGVIKVSVTQAGTSIKKTVAMSVADAGKSAQASAVERKAEDLIARLGGNGKAQAERLLAGLRAASGDARTQAEDALLDFIVDHEADDDDDE
jgi:molecular chaperone DnaK